MPTTSRLSTGWPSSTPLSWTGSPTPSGSCAGSWPSGRATKRASFLLANILYRTGRLAEAAALYGEIAASSQVEASRTEALANKSRIEKEMRGAP